MSPNPVNMNYSVSCVWIFALTVRFTLISTRTTWLFTTASCGPARLSRELRPRHPSSPSPSLSYLLVEKHKGSLCSEKGRRSAVTRTGTWCQRICPSETTFGVFGRRRCFGNNRIKRGQKEQNMWLSHGTTSVKTKKFSFLDQCLNIWRIFCLNGCCLTSAGDPECPLSVSLPTLSPPLTLS